jgi:hypothetical protein
LLVEISDVLTKKNWNFISDRSFRRDQCGRFHHTSRADHTPPQPLCMNSPLVSLHLIDLINYSCIQILASIQLNTSRKIV